MGETDKTCRVQTMRDLADPAPGLESESEGKAVRRRLETEVRPFFAAGRAGSFAATGGITLRYVAFPAERPAGALVILPGKGEPYLKYAELLYDLRGPGLSIYALDHRGMGHSDRLLPDRRKVHVERFDHYVEDAVILLRGIVRQEGVQRIALLGHSTGALVAARLLQEHPGEVAAAVLSSPAFRPRLGLLPGGLVAPLARLLDRPGRGRDYAPGEERAARLPFERNLISHSLTRWRVWEEEIPARHPGVVLGGVTRRWLRELACAGNLALRGAGAVREPVLLLQAGDDRVVHTRPQERFCRRCPTCTLLRLDGSRHEIPIEADGIRDPALRHIRSFLKAHLPLGPEYQSHSGPA